MSINLKNAQKWERAKQAINDYHAATDDSKNEIAASEFVVFLLAILKKKNITRLNQILFLNALLELKKELPRIQMRGKYLYKSLMENINFFFVRDRYQSYEIQETYTDLQNSKIICFWGPDYEEFENQMDKNNAENFILRFLKKYKPVIGNINTNIIANRFIKFYTQ